jgi:superfamily II DNA or RNA helicase
MSARKKRKDDTAAELLATLAFRYPWRPYQARVLHELEGHLTDDRVHIVAAPGAGKTILGLEMIRRLGSTSLILAPTLTIRDQWVARWRDDFCSSSSQDAHRRLINVDKDDDTFFQVETYQWMHQQIKSGSTGQFKRFDVFVLDEAHHLRQAWWRSLTSVLEQRPGHRLIALTATPPLGSDAKEWNRYRNLCGPIDAEISIPELIKTNNLCPHQDFIYLTTPDAADLDLIEKAAAERTCAMKAADESLSLLRAVLGHPFIGNTIANLHLIERSTDLFLAMLSFLKLRGITPAHVYDALGFIPETTPLNPSQLELLLDDLMRNPDGYFLLRGEFDGLRRTFAAARKIKAHRFRFRHSDKVEQHLARSKSKLGAISAILDEEATALGGALRMVVLATYIRSHYLGVTAAEVGEIDQLGVVPIALSLINGATSLADVEISIGAVSGSIIILPCKVAEKHALAMELARPLRASLDYVSIEANGETMRQLFDIVTASFRAGDINVLIGTASLLGEGWDEPEVNSLVLATQSASYVQVNQLRGRALRISKRQPDKTANIWHLACIDPTQPRFGPDVETLHQRFDGVVGLHHEEPLIQSGFERLACGSMSAKNVERFNQAMLQRASERQTLRQRWNIALGDVAIEDRDLLEERLYIPRERTAVKGKPTGWLTWLLFQLRSFVSPTPEMKAIKIAEALLLTLKAKKLVEPQARIDYDLLDGRIAVKLKNASKFDQEQLLNALSELMDIDTRSRYVVIDKSDVFKTPKLLQRLRDAEKLVDHWTRHAGPAKLIHISSLVGRRTWLRMLVKINLSKPQAPIRQALWIGNQSERNGP